MSWENIQMKRRQIGTRNSDRDGALSRAMQKGSREDSRSAEVADVGWRAPEHFVTGHPFGPDLENWQQFVDVLRENPRRIEELEWFRCLATESPVFAISAMLDERIQRRH